MADARRLAAELIGADEDEIALVEGTQHGLNLVAEGLGLRPGDRVVASDLEFFGTVLPWRSLAGVEVELVPHRDGRVEAADLEAAIDGRTRAVVVSSVQEITGFRVDLAALSTICRERGVLLVVDGAQHVGPVPLDVRKTPVDVLAVGGHKWLCSPFGLGFLYVRRGLLDRLEPAIPGYMTMTEPAQGWTAYMAEPSRTPADDFAFVQSARKLETGGTGPYLAAAALAGALRALLDIGPAAIAARVEALVARLVDGLTGLRVELVSALEPEHRSGIVVFRSSGEVEDDRRLVERLEQAGVAVSLRFSTGTGGIRVSPYLYNHESDVDRLLTALES